MYYKVQVFIPKENAQAFKDTLTDHGMATEGNYEYCFSILKERVNLSQWEKRIHILDKLVILKQLMN